MTGGFDIRAWVERVVTGGGGFQALEAHEMPLWVHERDVELAAFVIRCLALSSSKDSGDVLRAIQRQRTSLGCRQCGHDHGRASYCVENVGPYEPCGCEERRPRRASGEE